MRKGLSLLVLAAVCAAGVSGGAGPARDAVIAGAKEAVCLTATGFPVRPGGKLQLSFTARASNEVYAIEANPRLRNMAIDGRASRLRLEFYDEGGNRVPGFDVPVVSREFRRYVRVFHPPEAARSLKLFMLAGQASEMACGEVALTSELDGLEAGCVNCHPSFPHGDLNGYGYRPGYGGGFYTRPDGKTVWNSGFVGYTPPFPVRGGAYYRFRCTGKAYERKAAMEVDCYRADESKPCKSMRMAISENGDSTILLMPADAVRAEVRCYYVILESIEVAAVDGAVGAEGKP